MTGYILVRFKAEIRLVEYLATEHLLIFWQTVCIILQRVQIEEIGLALQILNALLTVFVAPLLLFHLRTDHLSLALLALVQFSLALGAQAALGCAAGLACEVAGTQLLLLCFNLAAYAAYLLRCYTFGDQVSQYDILACAFLFFRLDIFYKLLVSH